AMLFQPRGSDQILLMLTARVLASGKCSERHIGIHVDLDDVRSSGRFPRSTRLCRGGRALFEKVSLHGSFVFGLVVGLELMMNLPAIRRLCGNPFDGRGSRRTKGVLDCLGNLSDITIAEFCIEH